MRVPEQYWRFPTRQAIDSLAARFDLPNDPQLQDWEYEVADPARIEEFFSAYGQLSEDERFVLMCTLIQSFEDLKDDLGSNKLWSELLQAIEKEIDVHISTVSYWACEDQPLEHSWRVTPYMRQLLSRHKKNYV